MRLVQFVSVAGKRGVALVWPDGQRLQTLTNVSSAYALALEAHRTGRPLAGLIEERTSHETLDYEQIILERRLLPPLDHPDPAHCLITGTGLTHLGSAQARQNMHLQAAKPETELTDSMRIFRQGLEGGKPAPGTVGFQPEWFYKGSGDCLVPPEQPLPLPPWALDGGEEAEIAGLYVIGDKGEVLRVGFALGNEYSDHVMERQNYLNLAHSKLRACSIGPELLLGELPQRITGRVRVLREGDELWTAELLTGEENMSHSLANLEHHQFKYDFFRRPGDVHCHFFGAAVLSFSAGVKARPGDVFEISAPPFGRPLRNPLQATGAGDRLISVQPL